MRISRTFVVSSVSVALTFGAATPAMAHDVTNVEVKPHVEVKPTVHVHGSSAGCDVLGGARNLYEVVFNAFDDVHEKAHEVQDNLFGFHI
ncbi:hypothetical protein [Corynebacterium mastitidis]|uniref:hypothetical protein n=1 Tax=Corynebacterium mastitidis TaxID=161890 RepID=UPI00254FFD45|nr:hypothetical protein [Corynebacterium mastitidis]MDK8451155.1 hypothetical protein [Corynebacterium mastitidis]